MKFFTKIIVLLLLIHGSVFAQIDRVEPPFWWTDMKHSDLQILFYGKNIAQYQPTVSDAIIIKEVLKTENPNYVFITIDTKNVKAGTIRFSFKNNNKTAFTKDYTFKARKENSAHRKSYDASDMMYLIMPDRFANGDTSNDSHKTTTEKVNRSLPGGRHGGDIQGIINHLDYIKELGATTLWSTPLLEDNDPVYSYHTYGQSDVYKIDPRYGTNEDYLRLADELHKRDMKLVMDYVTNHWGAQHWMIKDLPTYNWIHQFPGYAKSNYRMATQYDPNASQIDTKYCLDGWFVDTMPDLNQSNPLVLNYLTQNAIWWIEYANLDGFRVDTYSYNDKAAIAQWTKSITDEYPYFNIVGEVWMHDQAQIAFWQKDSKIGAIKNYNSYLPSVMDFTLHDAVTSVFNEDKEGWSDGMIKVYDNFVNDFLYPDVNNLLIFAENHDTHRINHLYKNDFKKYKMTMALIATVRGIPQLYYGSEIGMAGNKDEGDAAIRLDFPGGWKGDTNNAFTKAGRTTEQQQYFDFTAQLFQWRKGNKAIHSGKTTHYIPENNVYVYFRYTDDQTVMILINNSVENQEVKTQRFSENLQTYQSGKEVLTGARIELKGQVSMEPKSVLILELNE
ncbi:glycoside hydrolase family 13 protein [Flavobacterium sp. '19STA2R22 D10 B1']|uniref:glycoside hydrolase family 13 protein n=1 Tax=Flavobacterium aerium TaxID=3037261 RepID=UPI00278BC140|nr:glycoside hydrolase family 13 protein [Flavobacterium sp. '19STA2R22 D10 B1']